MRIAWFDLESTGLPPFDANHTKIIEIAVVVTNHFRDNDDCFSQLVNPERDIPPRITEITKITSKMVEGAPVFKQVAAQVFQLMDGVVWAGHNITAFDIPLLEREFKIAGHPFPKCAGVIDTLLVAREHFKGRPGLANQKLVTLCHYFGALHPRQAIQHRAIHDVDATIKLAKNMFAQLYLEKNDLKPQQQQKEAVEVKQRVLPAFLRQYDEKEEPLAREQLVTNGGKVSVRCTARTRYSQYKLQCRNPSVNGTAFCRLHGLVSVPNQSPPGGPAFAAEASTSPPTRPT